MVRPDHQIGVGFISLDRLHSQQQKHPYTILTQLAPAQHP
jgi:hypothetical protein